MIIQNCKIFTNFINLKLHSNNYIDSLCNKHRKNIYLFPARVCRANIYLLRNFISIMKLAVSVSFLKILLYYLFFIINLDFHSISSEQSYYYLDPTTNKHNFCTISCREINITFVIFIILIHFNDP